MTLHPLTTKGGAFVLKLGLVFTKKFSNSFFLMVFENFFAFMQKTKKGKSCVTFFKSSLGNRV